jgi:hypothetical protein
MKDGVMKRIIFNLIFCIALLNIEPIYAMEQEPDDDTPWHIALTQKFREGWDSFIDVVIPHKCSVCTGEPFPTDPNKPLQNGL